MRDHHNESVHPAIQFDENLMEPPVSMMLERMIDMTGEFYHLVELIEIMKKRNNSGACSFHEIVLPVLIGLDREIKYQFHPGMEFIEMRLIVQDWIDAEIRRLGR